MTLHLLDLGTAICKEPLSVIASENTLPYLFKADSKTFRTRNEICSKLTKHILERRQ